MDKQLTNFLKTPPRFSFQVPVAANSNQTLLAPAHYFKTGDICFLTDTAGQQVQLIAGNFDSKYIRLQPLQKLKNISPDSRIYNPATGSTIRIAENPTGRVLNCLGDDLLDNQATERLINIELLKEPPLALYRKPINKIFRTGINAIDGFLTIGRGQRLGLFAEAGTGKSTLLGMLARNSQSDINVLALIGERGREVREFIDESLGPAGLKKSIVVCATSDETPAARRTAALTAIGIAEHYRARGKNVLLLMDSLTRLARAIREIGLNEGELPIRQGYTPSVFTELPGILERTGNDHRGSITAIFTVLCNSELESDPLAEEIKSLLDGHIVLSRRLAEAVVRPAIDICRSVSRCFNRLHTPDYQRTIQEIKKLYARAQKDQDLLLFGGQADQELQNAIKTEQRVNKIISQGLTAGLSWAQLKTTILNIV